MRSSVSGVAFVALCCVGLVALANAQQASNVLQPGIVVEEVAKNSDAELMGFTPGDVILSWTRGERHGKLESPLDLIEIEVQELPLGSVALMGVSGTENRTWHWTESKKYPFREGNWGVIARPNLTGLLTGYEAAARATKSGKATDAARLWQTTAREAQDRHLPAWVASWLWLRSAESLVANKEWTAANEACQEALRIAGSDGSAEIKIARACAEAFLKQNADKDAEKYYQFALTEQRKSNAAGLGYASLLIGLSRIASSDDDLDKARDYALQAQQIQEQLAPDSLVFAATLNRIGFLMQGTGELEQSRDYFLRTIALREQLAPQSPTLAMALQNLGDTLLELGDLDKAGPYHLHALELWSNLAPDSSLLAGCLVDMATGADLRGEWAKAEDYLRRALKIQRKLRPRGYGPAASLNNLGLLLLQRDQLTEAEDVFRQSLAIREELEPGSLNVAVTLGNLGNVFLKQGNLAQAEEYFTQSLKIREKAAPKSVEVAIVYSELGDLALQRNDIQGAENWYQKAYALQTAIAPGAPMMAEVFQNLGETAWRKGNVQEAESNYLHALEIRKRLDPASAEYAETLISLAKVARSKQQWDLATLRFQQGLDALEAQTARLGGAEEVRAGFRARHENYYREYMDLLISQNKTERAFEILERSRARTLLETLAAAHIDIHKGVGPELIAREHLLQRNIKAKSERRIQLLIAKHTEEQIKVVEKEISDLINEYQDVEGQIRFNSPAYAALMQPQPLDVRAVQRLLPENTLLLEYALGEERSHVFSVSAGTVNVYELPKKTIIEDQARLLYQLITERTRIVKRESERERSARWKKADTQSRRTAAVLSAMILAPLISELQGWRLLIVSDGALQYVPFAALSVRKSASHRVIPLIAEHEIVSLPSASVLALLRERGTRHKVDREVAIFADPVFGVNDSRVQPTRFTAISETEKAHRREEDNGFLRRALPEALARSVMDTAIGSDGRLELPRLAFTRDESKAIMSTLPAGSALEALGFNATRDLAMSGELSRYRVVHFATHALVDNIHPELSGLVLSLLSQKREPVDGFLALGDIYNLDLPADLVVLSACQTALGKEVNGEGIIGLTRGFMYAGAPGVVSTLWSVNDFATARLMAHFYRFMEQEKIKPAQALRRAQLALWKERSSSAPFYWAGFILQGDWE